MQIHEIELLSDNVSATGSFYHSVLGLEVYAGSNTSVTFAIGYTKVIFRQSKNMKPVYHFAFDVPNNRFEDAYNYIKAKTGLIEVTKGNDIADFKNWDAKSFYFHDNNGNIVEIITRFANHAFANEPFDGTSFLSVSEVGLVTGNVPQLADKLTKEFGIPIFHRQPRGERFTVSGDDCGLFILAETGREWYPTGSKAFSFRTRIVFSEQGCLSHIIM